MSKRVAPDGAWLLRKLQEKEVLDAKRERECLVRVEGVELACGRLLGELEKLRNENAQLGLLTRDLDARLKKLQEHHDCLVARVGV